MMKNGFRFLVSFGIGLTLTSMAIEIFLRLSYIAPVSPTEFYEDIGRGRKSNTTYVYFNEGLGIGRFNKHRFIGAEVAIDKPVNTYRVALIGDSYVESFQVFQRNYFGQIAQKQLNESSKTLKFEVLNFGRSGFDIGDSYAYGKLFVNKFEPDLSLYFLSNNDLDPLYSDPLRPKTVVQNDRLVILKDYDAGVLHKFQATKFLTQNSVVFSMLSNCVKKSKTTPVSAILFDKFYFIFNASGDDSSSALTNHQERLTHPVAREIIRSFSTENVVIVNSDSIALPEAFIQLCIENNVPILDLENQFAELRNTGVDPTYWPITKKQGHWNELGHQAIGSYLATFIAEKSGIKKSEQASEATELINSD